MIGPLEGQRGGNRGPGMLDHAVVIGDLLCQRGRPDRDTQRIIVVNRSIRAPTSLLSKCCR